MSNKSKTLITVSLLAGLTLLALPTGAAFAQAEDPPAGTDESSEQPKSLEERYAKLVDRYEKAGDRLDEVHELISKVEDRIEERAAEGKDTARAQVALDSFLKNLASVEAAYAEVGMLIDEPAGFNDAGEAVDEDQALLTLLDIAEGLLDVTQFSQDAKFDLRRDLIGYRYQN
jgi:TolA-binding protein